MNATRLEAFSDGVMAIIITITVLGIRVPETPDLEGLKRVLPVLLIYAWSFQMVGTYWNNHHHLLRVTHEVSPAIMWANLHLLFWLSLIPLTTEWLGRNIGAAWPTAVYCAVLLISGASYDLLEQAILGVQGHDKDLTWVMGRRVRDIVSLLLYAAAVGAAFVAAWASYVLVVLSSALWLLPGGRRRSQPA